MDEEFGEIIDYYGAEQAIEDGVLVHPYPERWPWLLITNSIHAVCSDTSDGRTYDQRLVPLLMDCIMEAQKSQRTGKVPPLKLQGTVAGDVLIVPNEMGGMTVKLPGE